MSETERSMTKTNWAAFTNWLNSELDYADEAFLKKVNQTKEEYVDEIGLEYIQEVVDGRRENDEEADYEADLARDVAELASEAIKLSMYLGAEVYALIEKDIKDGAADIYRKYPTRTWDRWDKALRESKRLAYRLIDKVSAYTTQPGFVRYKIEREIFAYWRLIKVRQSC